MEKYALNDEVYNFKPLELFEPDSDYQIDEKELQESMQKSRDLIARIRNTPFPNAFTFFYTAPSSPRTRPSAPC